MKLRTKEDLELQVQVDSTVAKKFSYIADSLRFTETSDEVVPVPIGAATMQSLVQWAAPLVLQEADLQSLLDMMTAADLLGLPGFLEAAVLALPNKLGNSLAQRCQKLEEITESGLPEPVRQHLQGLLTDEVRELWEHGSLVVTVSRELNLRLLEGLNIQGLAMGGGGGFVGDPYESDGEGDGGASGHLATMKISNIPAVDKKFVVKIGAGGQSCWPDPDDPRDVPQNRDGGYTVVEMEAVELVRALGGSNGSDVVDGGGEGAIQGWELLKDIPVRTLKQGRGGKGGAQGGLVVDETGPEIYKIPGSFFYPTENGYVQEEEEEECHGEGYGAGGGSYHDVGKDGVVIIYQIN